ncbi:hypothetical protein GSI_15169 [Ganoderma sinense ZZ0214-1]|uniref:Thioesterase domain-containing protein n=1 Tax=Ganoderma sinense ZZ0214-1 TaxID=1077348 RepID=A0A2G8RLU7_9APHY|nr:hypothetical protein GSI_15169 [Ganoderma sinense ZZ0214-1]
MSLTDTLGSLAVATKGHYMTGVSVDIGTSFVKPAGRAGDELIAKAVITGIGKSLAYTRVDFYNVQGQLAAYGRCSSSASLTDRRISAVLLDQLFLVHVIFPIGFSPSPTTPTALDHTKYVGKSAGHKHDVKFSEDGEYLIEGADID